MTPVHSLHSPAVIPLCPKAVPEPKPRYSQCLEATEAPEHAPMHGLQLVSRQHQLLHTCCSIEGTLPHLLDPIIAQVSRRRGTERGGSSGWRELSPQLPDTGFSASVLTDMRSLLTAGREIHTAQDLKGLSVIIYFFECLEESLLLFFTRCAVSQKRAREEHKAASSAMGMHTFGGLVALSAEAPYKWILPTEDLLPTSSLGEAT